MMMIIMMMIMVAMAIIMMMIIMMMISMMMMDLIFDASAWSEVRISGLRGQCRGAKIFQSDLRVEGPMQSEVRV